MPRAPFIFVALMLSLPALKARSADQEKPAPAESRGDGALPALSHSTVSLPLEDLRVLLGKGPSNRPPIDFAFAPASYQAAVTGKGVAITAAVDVTLLVDSWALVPIGPSNSGVTSATVDGHAVPLVLRGDQLFLLIEGKGEKKLSLTISRDLVTDAGTVRFDLPLLPSALVDVSVSLPAKSQNPRASEAGGVTITENGQATVMKGSFHGGTVATFQWRPAPLPGVAVEARTDADVATLLTIDRGIVRAKSNLRVQVANASPKELKIDVDAKLKVVAVTGKDIAEWTEAPAGADRKTITVRLGTEIEGERVLDVDAERDLPVAGKEDAGKETGVDFQPPSLIGATRDRGFIGVEIRDNVQATPAQPGRNMQRIDVEELPDSLLAAARSPVLFGYRYDAPDAKLTLALTRNADLDVLVAMCDICEASTTYTPDGKSITKMMLITRNNLKQFMTLKLPEGAQVWSTFVGDHPVTPARNSKGEVLVPLRKSDPEDADDDDIDEGKSYRAQRERRRAEGLEGKAVDHLKRIRETKSKPDDGAAPDLKPYDVEIVFVTAATKLPDRGQVHPALPQLDVPIGHLSWAVFLPANLKVLETDGNVTEVSRFTLPFRHFGDVAYERGQHALKQDQAQEMQAAAQALEKQAQQVAERAKARGVLPVRIEIPMVGEIHRFEKFLTVEESPAVAISYRRGVE